MEEVFLSCIIPVRNGSRILQKTLPSLIKSCNNASFSTEIIIVDNDSRDNTLEVLKDYPVKTITVPQGVTKARNAGAMASLGKYILFLDSDILVNDDTIKRVGDVLTSSDCDAIVGLLSLDILSKSLATRYKNLWMHFSYTILPDYIAGFYTSIAAIKRDVFLESGGFDENYNTPSVEDTVIGRRLIRLGKKILLVRDLEVVHLKEYRTKDVLRLDLRRSASLLKVILRERLERIQGASVPYSFMLSLPFAYLFFLSFLMLLFIGITGLLLPFFLLSVIYLLNIKLLFFILKRESISLFLWALWFLPVDLIAVGLGILTGFIEYYMYRNKY